MLLFSFNPFHYYLRIGSLISFKKRNRKRRRLCGSEENVSEISFVGVVVVVQDNKMCNNSRAIYTMNRWEKSKSSGKGVEPSS